MDDDFYKAMRAKIRAWLAGKGKAFAHADLLLVGPDLLHLLCKLSADPRIPLLHKAQVVAAIAYFLSPIDLLPEALLGPVGLIDDIALSAYVLRRMINAGHGAVAEEHWAGDGQLLQVLQRILEFAGRALGSNLWSRLKRQAPRG
jgi:uncharacterized membrane protein YkvA (DUF1232 family)